MAKKRDLWFGENGFLFQKLGYLTNKWSAVQKCKFPELGNG